VVIELIRRHRWLIIFATTLSTLSAAAGIGIVQMITDEIAQLRSSNVDLVYSLPFFIMVICFVIGFNLASQYLLTKMGASISNDIRKIMSRRLMATKYQQIEELGPHRIFATMTQDVASLSEGIMLIPKFIYSFTTLVFCFTFMLYHSWQLFLLVVAMVSIVVLVVKLLLNVGIGFHEQHREINDDLFAGLDSIVKGAKELAVDERRKKFLYYKVLIPVYDGLKVISIKTDMVFVLLSTWTSSTLFFMLVFILYGAKVMFPGIPIEVVVGFLLITLYMVDPFEQVMEMLDDLGQYIVALKKIESLGLAETSDSSLEQLNNNVHFNEWDSIKLKGLTYQYNNENSQDYTFGVGPIDLTIQRGETLFVVGGNGSGKSTFAKLLTGIYEPGSGQIVIGDKRVDFTQSTQWYQSLFSVIFADFHLFEHVLNKDGDLADDERVNHYLDKLKLDKKVFVTDGKLSTIDLSQGQKKRVALLLSYLQDTSICIYDEWAADQDPEFRHYFYHELLPELKAAGKTIIAITHDDRYFNLADRIIKLDQGMIYQHKTSKLPKEKIAEPVL
jgi:putative ATP-binding cassette transporter